MIDLEKAKKAFMEYVNNYDLSCADIEIKLYHSLRVSEYSEKIAKGLNLTEEQIKLATLIGLLHDIARFEQFKTYKTFADKKSIDHGNFGVKILEKDNLIRKFIETDKYDEIIKKAIINHNKYKIEDGLSEECLLQAKIIRDADKLDIFYEGVELFWQDEEIIKEIEESLITEECLVQFKQNETVSRNLEKTKLDSVIVLVAFIFDLNFEYSKQLTIKENYIAKILNRFDYKNENTKKQITEILEIANQFLMDNKSN